jgi:hypothetical protein
LKNYQIWGVDVRSVRDLRNNPDFSFVDFTGFPRLNLFCLIHLIFVGFRIFKFRDYGFSSEIENFAKIVNKQTQQNCRKRSKQKWGICLLEKGSVRVGNQIYGDYVESNHVGFLTERDKVARSFDKIFFSDRDF